MQNRDSGLNQDAGGLVRPEFDPHRHTLVDRDLAARIIGRLEQIKTSRGPQSGEAEKMKALVNLATDRGFVSRKELESLNRRLRELGAERL
ncbi:MAG: hypothetical protein HY397_04085 [Candidatus Doudnabacteria bacterium]|nr:hypothetical protein [Candidatus Doudnabacteria bacterium]